MKAAPQKEPLLTWPKMAGLLNVVDCTAAATQPGDGGSGRPWLTWPVMVGLVNDVDRAAVHTYQAMVAVPSPAEYGFPVNTRQWAMPMRRGLVGCAGKTGREHDGQLGGLEWEVMRGGGSGACCRLLMPSEGCFLVGGVTPLNATSLPTHPRISASPDEVPPSQLLTPLPGHTARSRRSPQSAGTPRHPDSDVHRTPLPSGFRYPSTLVKPPQRPPMRPTTVAVAHAAFLWLSIPHDTLLPPLCPPLPAPVTGVAVRQFSAAACGPPSSPCCPRGLRWRRTAALWLSGVCPPPTPLLPTWSVVVAHRVPLSGCCAPSVSCPHRRALRWAASNCAVHLVAGSNTRLDFPQIARKRSLKTGSCSHAGSVCSYPD